MNKRKKKRPLVIEEKHRVAAKIFAQGDCFSLQDVADRVGVCRQTLWRWWQRREFRDLCERERRHAVADAKRQWRRKSREEWKRDIKTMRKFEKENPKKTKEQQMRDLIMWAKEQHMPPDAIAEIKESFNESQKK